MKAIEVSVIIPCLNEEFTISDCIGKCFKLFEENHINGEVLVIDNGSSDNSRAIAKESGAIVINEPQRGYGRALITGIQLAEGKYILMGDGDDTYDFSQAYPFIIYLRKGYQLVMGNRFLGKIEKGAMPFTHRYIGNPMLSYIGKKLFNVDVGDFHCGMRGFVRDDFLKLNLQSSGMEFASEIVVSASQKGYRITEIPINLYCSNKNRKSKLRTIRDGMRHLIYLIKAKEKDIIFFESYKFAKYITIGVLSQIVCLLCLFVFCDCLNIQYIVSGILADSISLFVSYFMNNRWTFHQSNNRKYRLFKVLLCHIINILVSCVLMFVLTSLLGINYLLSKLIIVGMSCIINFFVAKNYIYK